MKPFELIVEEPGAEKKLRQCQLLGYLDAHTVLKFEESLNDLLEREGASQLIVDIGQLKYISSSGIGAFMGLTQRARQLGGELVLVNPTEKVYNILSLLGFNKVFKIVDTQQEALEALQDQQSLS